MTNRYRILAAAVLAIALPQTRLLAAPATQPANLADEIQAVKTRIARLEAQQRDIDQKRREAEQQLQDRLSSDELSKDAARHDQFLTAEGFTAGYSDNRFVIQDDEGNFVLHPWAHLQFRAVENHRDDIQGTAANPESEDNLGFEVRQLRVGADGNMFSPDLTYFFNWATQRTSGNVNVTSTTGTTKGTVIGSVSNSLGGGLILQQAWVKYHIPASPFYIKAGAMKDPILHEQIVDTRYQQGAERSVAADIFVNGDAFTEAATFIFDPNAQVRTEVGINHGMRGANTNFESYANNGGYNQFNYGFVGRVEYKFMGQWKDFSQVGGVNVKEPLLVLGSGTDYSERGHAGQTVTAIDATYVDPNGLNIFGEFMDRYTTHNFGYYIQSATGANIVAGDPAVAGKPTNEYAFVAEAGYMLDQHMEPFARYEFMHLQGTPAASHNWVEVIAGGMNYYFSGYRMKVTAEAQWLPEGLPFDDTSNDVLANTNGKSELTFIGQIQLIL